MAQTFSFGDFTQRCRQACLPALIRPAPQLARLYRDCESQLDRYHPERFKLLDCKPGCGSCCIVNVSVLFPEALAIVEYLEAQAAPAVRGFGDRLDYLWTCICGVADEERVCMRKPCFFLDQAGSCSIYPVRPLLCRGVTSTDADSCRSSFNAYLHNEQLPVRMNLFQSELYTAAFSGLSAGLDDQGLDGRSFELTGLVRFLLRNLSARQKLLSGLRLDWGALA